jgi:glycosyltransferase involved in cell wall biosynthesis
MNSRKDSFAIVSPVRNEADFLPKTIEAIVSQTIRPLSWVIVDDGSTDDTLAIAQKAASQYSFIKAISRPDRGFRLAGTGVIEAFYDGYNLLKDEPWDFLVKMDADVTFDPTYFEECYERFKSDPKLGIGGGTICSLKSNVLQPESVDPAFHVRGATKIYRRECWDGIGGLIRAPGWDTLDEVKANMLGWTTLTFPEIRLLHFRPAGEAYGRWSNWTKNGMANYILAYHPLFMFLKCCKRMFVKPYVLSAIGLFFGYFKGYVTNRAQVDDRELIRYFRHQQMNMLLGRKSLWK